MLTILIISNEGNFGYRPIDVGSLGSELAVSKALVSKWIMIYD